MSELAHVPSELFEFQEYEAEQQRREERIDRMLEFVRAYHATETIADKNKVACIKSVMIAKQQNKERKEADDEDARMPDGP